MALLNRRWALVQVVAAPVFLAALAVTGVGMAATVVDDNVLSYLTREPKFATTVKLLYMTGYLNSAQNVTVFAPTETAWDSGDYRSSLSYQNRTTSSPPEAGPVVAILRGLAVHGTYPPDRLAQAQKVQDFLGEEITVDATATHVRWKGHDGAMHEAAVVGEPVICANGVVYPVDVVVGQ
jgi:uncharacterized surface protein with fasciclin (FAS1) repeats